MNPTFSSSKLKELTPLIINCTDRLLSVIETKKNQKIDVSDFFKRFTMDSIWNCAFGVDIDLQNNHENLYYHKCEKVFKQGLEFRLLNYLGVYVHEIKELIMEVLIFLYRISVRFLSEDGVSPFFWLANKIEEIIDKQRNEKDMKQLVRR